MRTVSASRHLLQPHSNLPSESLALISAITSILNSLNPQDPKTHQNPNPSVLNQFSLHLTPNLVIQTVKNLTNPYHSLFFFNWASSPSPNRNHYFHTHFCYIAITDKLLSHRLFSLAADLLRTHKKFSDFMVGKFITVHGDLGHLKSAVNLFRQVKEKEPTGCLFSFNALLGALSKANKVGHVLGYFAQYVIKVLLVKPDVSTYTIMINGLCKMGMIVDAEKLFDEMTCGKNLVTYNTIIHGFCKKGLMDKAQRVVDKMVGDETCLPDIVSYTTLIDGYFKKRECGNAMRCFHDMVSGGNCKPNVLTYNVLVNGLCLNGDVEEARRMMTRMRLSGVKDNIATHTSLLKGFCIAGRSDEAIRHFKEMVNHGMNLDGHSYAVIVNEYSKLGRPDEGIVLLWEMRARGITPLVASFNAVFRSLVKLEELDKAISLLKQMPRMGCCPNFLSYREVIIGHTMAKGRMEDVEMLVNDMIRDGHAFDTSLYSFLIKAYCINGCISKSLNLFKQMIAENLVIRIECFDIFVTELCSRGLVHEVENLFEWMRNSCLMRDFESYQSILNECLSGNRDC